MRSLRPPKRLPAGTFVGTDGGGAAPGLAPARGRRRASAEQLAENKSACRDRDRRREIAARHRILQRIVKKYPLLSSFRMTVGPIGTSGRAVNELERSYNAVRLPACVFPVHTAHSHRAGGRRRTSRRDLDMGIISWIILGLIAGFIASKIVNKTGSGIIMDIVLGVVGAIVGGFIVEPCSASAASPASTSAASSSRSSARSSCCWSTARSSRAPDAPVSRRRPSAPPIRRLRSSPRSSFEPPSRRMARFQNGARVLR